MDEETLEMIESFNETYTEYEEMFGHPYQELQDYFLEHPQKGSILDLGCGQGRDALFLATIGYQVTAVDISSVGISQMLSKAKQTGLEINGLVGDIIDVQITDKFDIILFDMILHSFDERSQLVLLKKYVENLNPKGSICIIFPDDIKKEHFLEILNRISGKWKILHEKIVYDVPVLEGMESEEDFTFNLIVFQK